MRHRKSWARSSSVGALNEVIWTPWGSTSPTVWRSTPPLPEVSMPWSTSSTRRVRPRPTRSANSRSCRSASSAPSAASASLPASLSPSKPGVASVSMRVRSTGPVGRRRHATHGAHAVAGQGLSPAPWPRRGCSRPRCRCCRRPGARRTRCPRTNPALSSTRSEASLRWSGAAKYDVASREAVPRAAPSRPTASACRRRGRATGLADRVVDADRLRVGRQQRRTRGSRAIR